MREIRFDPYVAVISLGSGWLLEGVMIWREGLVCCRGKCLKTMVLEL